MRHSEQFNSMTPAPLLCPTVPSQIVPCLCPELLRQRSVMRHRERLCIGRCSIKMSANTERCTGCCIESFLFDSRSAYQLAVWLCHCRLSLDTAQRFLPDFWSVVLPVGLCHRSDIKPHTLKWRLCVGISTLGQKFATAGPHSRPTRRRTADLVCCFRLVVGCGCDGTGCTCLCVCVCVCVCVWEGGHVVLGGTCGNKTFSQTLAGNFRERCFLWAVG